MSVEQVVVLCAQSLCADLARLSAAALAVPAIGARAVELLEAGVQVARVEDDAAAAPGAGTARLQLHLADAYLQLLPALAAGNGQRH